MVEAGRVEPFKYSVVIIRICQLVNSHVPPLIPPIICCDLVCMGVPGTYCVTEQSVV